MTRVIIKLNIGDNYISFPAKSTNTIGEILSSSGVKGNILKFIKWDSIQQKEVPVYIDGAEYIEEGRGYYLYATYPGNITYDGTEYSITFDQFRLRIVKGWNLLGVGKDAIVPQFWCKILDPITNTPVSILEPTKSYMVNYDECIPPSGASTESAVGLAVSIFFLIYMLRGFKPF